MSILDEIGEPTVWRAFFDHKTDCSLLTRQEILFFDEFISSDAYSDIAARISAPDFRFSIPQKKLVNKLGSTKKRVVYTFTAEENAVLKLIAHLLSRYDGTLCPNCYAFRRNYGVKQAIRRVTTTENIGNKYCLKLDIRNYFNSIDTDILLVQLKQLFSDDLPLYDFFEKLLDDDRAVFAGETLQEHRGVMAGTPTSPFFANVYLSELDRLFHERHILYARYSDDIIVFADSAEQIDGYEKEITDFLSRMNLSINPDKLHRYSPGEPWVFLGVEFKDGKVDISKSTLDKLKGKIRRKARALYRWKLKTGATDKKAMSVFARVMNKKLFNNERTDELTWTRWFFPLITTTESLEKIDEYIRENMRYIATGKHNKRNYSVRYSELKDCGLVSLVNAYYKTENPAKYSHI